MVLREVIGRSFFRSSLFTGLMLLPLFGLSQKLKSNGVDKNTKKWRMETFPANLRSSADTKMDVSIYSADSSFFLEVMGSGIGTSTVDVNNEIVFLLDNDSTVKGRSLLIQSIEYGESIPGYHHEYAVSFDGLERLSRHNLKSIRKYSAGGFDDIVIEKKNASKVKELSNFFVEEVKKAKLVPETGPTVSPGFPGGTEVLANFLNRNLKPPSDLQLKEPVKAEVQFIVNADGNISDLRIKQSAGTAVDTELLRILNRMPKWKPALKNGKEISYTVTQMLTFNSSGLSIKIQLIN